MVGAGSSLSWRQAYEDPGAWQRSTQACLPPSPHSGCFSPGLAVVLRAETLPDDLISETRTVFAEGTADFLGNFPERRWACPGAGCGVEFTVLLTVLVAAYRKQVTEETLGDGPVT